MLPLLIIKPPPATPGPANPRRAARTNPPIFLFSDSTAADVRNGGGVAHPPRQAAPRETQTQSGAAPITKGQEVEAILKEVQKMNRGLVLTALEDAQGLEFRDGVLTTTFGNDDVLAKRVRDSGQLFRDVGQRLFGRPLNLEVR